MNPEATSPLLEIRGLNIAFDTSRGQIRPVRDLSLNIFSGQTVALVGESGCGKSVTSLSVLRLIPEPPGKVLSGQIILSGRNLMDLNESEMRKVRGKEVAMIFQEPMTSLNPVYSIGDQIIEAVQLHQRDANGRPVSTRAAADIAEKALAAVGIADPRRRLREFPHQMSGGMRQRVMIAMALSCQPKLLIADEPTTALDVTIQAQILELLRELQQSTGMSILLITHDLGVVAENSDVVAVMYASRVVEFAKVEDLFDTPLHPYTEGLLRSVPKLGQEHERLETISGAVPNPANFPAGCKFHPRCPQARVAAQQASAVDTVEVRTPEETFRVPKICATQEPELREIEPQHWSACHLAAGYNTARVSLPVLNYSRTVTASAIGTEHEGTPLKQELNS